MKDERSPEQKEIDILRKMIARITVSLQRDMAYSTKAKADTAAVLSIVRELGTGAGLPEVHCQEVFRLRSEWFYQRFLENTEDVSASLAALLGTVIPSTSDPAADWPKLFPDPDEEAP